MFLSQPIWLSIHIQLKSKDPFFNIAMVNMFVSIGLSVRHNLTLVSLGLMKRGAKYGNKCTTTEVMVIMTTYNNTDNFSDEHKTSKQKRMKNKNTTLSEQFLNQ